jgi:hypothetical protein
MAASCNRVGAYAPVELKTEFTRKEMPVITKAALLWRRKLMFLVSSYSERTLFASFGS